MTGAAVMLSARKELRALLPAWAACMIALGAATAIDTPFLMPFAVLIYVLGSVALGAQSVGHEYAHRTLGLLLSQPIDRRRVYLVKLAVLALLLAVLGVLALFTVGAGIEQVTEHPKIGVRSASLVVLGALFIAPYFTMLTRSSIAGMVFAVGAAGMVGIAGNLVWFATSRTLSMEDFRELLFWPVMYLLCAGTAVAGWRLFMRLEAIEGRGRELHLPFRSASSRGVPEGRRRSPYVLLIAKELRLHQMALVIAALTAIAVVAIVTFKEAFSTFELSVAIPMTFLHMGAMPVLIGSLASAEERQLGTREWQLLMPMPAWKQFAVKAGVAIALSLVLGLSVPALTIWMLSARFDSVDWKLVALLVVVLASVSLYVSSLSTSGIRALVMAMPLLLAAQLAINWLGHIVWLAFGELSRSWPGWRPPRLALLRTPSGELLLITAAALLTSALVLHYAHLNHRSAERPGTQLPRQAGWIAAAVVAQLTFLTLAGVR